MGQPPSCLSRDQSSQSEDLDYLSDPPCFGRPSESPDQRALTPQECPHCSGLTQSCWSETTDAYSPSRTKSSVVSQTTSRIRSYSTMLLNWGLPHSNAWNQSFQSGYDHYDNPGYLSVMSSTSVSCEPPCVWTPDSSGTGSPDGSPTAPGSLLTRGLGLPQDSPRCFLAPEDDVVYMGTTTRSFLESRDIPRRSVTHDEDEEVMYIRTTTISVLDSQDISRCSGSTHSKHSETPTSNVCFTITKEDLWNMWISDVCSAFTKEDLWHLWNTDTPQDFRWALQLRSLHSYKRTED
ncbi:hypothetical protein J4Q44_G00017540 [Coregonus suidteri]|uniref:Uncharacterized protein n=1 Tax=Coregonus suidteri TaxID=861788 RepID=A0AAN8MAS8_9TELE